MEFVPHGGDVRDEGISLSDTANAALFLFPDSPHTSVQAAMLLLPPCFASSRSTPAESQRTFSGASTMSVLASSLLCQQH